MKVSKPEIKNQSGECGFSEIEPDNQPARILVVDDVPEVRKSFANVLSRQGYEVETASDGSEALKKLKTGQFQLIVSDIAMPNMDGMELMRSVRKVDFDIPIILLTGAPSLETARQAVELGAFRYLTKPIDIVELENAARKALLSYRLSILKREALRLVGLDSRLPSDLAGLEVSFEKALSGLWIAFQPIVCCADGEVFGYEALMRSNERALPNPLVMLDAAERLGKVAELGRVVRERAREAMKKAPEHTKLFVNLHPSDLLDDDLFIRTAPLSAIAPRTVLEVTERATIHNLAAIRDRVIRLRRMGYQIAIDDLGSGYSGLSSFALLEPEFVKLDMSLTRDVDKNCVKQKLVRSMVRLCKEIGSSVVAEGIESSTERDTVVELGCDFAQGYYISKPDKPFPKANW